MLHKLNLLLLAWFSMAGCGSEEKESTDSQLVSGTYVHTYTADVIDPETGKVMGTRTVKDTIFIKESGDKFEVSNRKWHLNDYENEGWVTPSAEADSPMPTYLTEFDTAKKKLTPSSAGKRHAELYVSDEKIYWGEAKALEYTRVDD